MAIGLGSNFELRAKLPLDVRELFDTVADLKAYPENFLADSCSALVKDEPNTLFIFNRNNADDVELGKWRRLKGSDLTDYLKKVDADTLYVSKEDGKSLLSDTDKTKYDDAVTKAHKHTNGAVLDDLSDSNGILMYKGSIIGSNSGSGTTTGYTKTETDALLGTKVDKEDGKDLLADTDKTKYDDAVTKAHKHTNSAVLDKLTDNSGELEYNGKKISADLSTVYTKTEADALLATKVDKVDGKSLLSDTDKTKYDDAVTKAHEHTNSTVLDKLSEDVDGNPTYNGNAIGGSGASSADKVSYDNTGYPAYTDVSLALNALFDKVFYDKPVITSFVMTPADTLYEIGSTVDSITFDWSTNKNITEQTLTDCVLTDETVRTATYSTPLSTNKTFILSITDGQETVTAKKDIKFGWKVYYGSAADQTTYDDAFLLGLSDSVIKENKNGNYTVNVADNEYFYIALPESYNNSDEIVGKIGGFETSFDKVSSFAHTNASGSSTTYNVYRSTNHSLGSITFVI